jgi:hypothetical protein
MQFIKASNSFISQHMDITMGIYGTRIKERNKDKALGQIGTKSSEENSLMLVKRYHKGSKFDGIRNSKTNISNIKNLICLETSIATIEKYTSNVTVS